MEILVRLTGSYKERHDIEEALYNLTYNTF